MLFNDWLEYKLAWCDDPQSYTGKIATNLTLILPRGDRLPIDIYRLKKENNSLYERIKEAIHAEHQGEVMI